MKPIWWKLDAVYKTVALLRIQSQDSRAVVEQPERSSTADLRKLGRARPGPSSDPVVTRAHPLRLFTGLIDDQATLTRLFLKECTRAILAAITKQANTLSLRHGFVSRH